MEEKLVDIEDLEVHFPLKHETIRAVDGVSWNVNKGETLAIVGESGSGKSVTAMSLMRLTDYSGGKINSGSMSFLKKNGKKLDLSKLTQDEMRDIRGNDISMIFQEISWNKLENYRIAQETSKNIRQIRRTIV